jgi:hypothetical protein
MRDPDARVTDRLPLVSADMHWPLYETTRRGLEKLLEDNPRARDSPGSARRRTSDRPDDRGRQLQARRRSAARVLQAPSLRARGRGAGEIGTARGGRAASRDATKLGVADGCRRPHITDYRAGARRDPVRAAETIGGSDLVDALARDPMNEEAQQYLLDLGEIARGKARVTAP